MGWRTSAAVRTYFAQRKELERRGLGMRYALEFGLATPAFVCFLVWTLARARIHPVLDAFLCVGIMVSVASLVYRNTDVASLKRIIRTPYAVIWTGIAAGELYLLVVLNQWSASFTATSIATSCGVKFQDANGVPIAPAEVLTQSRLDTPVFTVLWALALFTVPLAQDFMVVRQRPAALLAWAAFGVVSHITRYVSTVLLAPVPVLCLGGDALFLQDSAFTRAASTQSMLLFGRVVGHAVTGRLESHTLFAEHPRVPTNHSFRADARLLFGLRWYTLATVFIVLGCGIFFIANLTGKEAVQYPSGVLAFLSFILIALNVSFRDLRAMQWFRNINVISIGAASVTAAVISSSLDDAGPVRVLLNVTFVFFGVGAVSIDAARPIPPLLFRIGCLLLLVGVCFLNIANAFQRDKDVAVRVGVLTVSASQALVQSYVTVAIAVLRSSLIAVLHRYHDRPTALFSYAVLKRKQLLMLSVLRVVEGVGEDIASESPTYNPAHSSFSTVATPVVPAATTSAIRSGLGDKHPMGTTRQLSSELAFSIGGGISTSRGSRSKSPASSTAPLPHDTEPAQGKRALASFHLGRRRPHSEPGPPSTAAVAPVERAGGDARRATLPNAGRAPGAEDSRCSRESSASASAKEERDCDGSGRSNCDGASGGDNGSRSEDSSDSSGSSDDGAVDADDVVDDRVHTLASSNSVRRGTQHISNPLHILQERLSSNCALSADSRSPAKSEASRASWATARSMLANPALRDVVLRAQQPSRRVSTLESWSQDEDSIVLPPSYRSLLQRVTGAETGTLSILDDKVQESTDEDDEGAS